MPQQIRDVLWLAVGVFFIGGFLYNVVARLFVTGISFDARTLLGFGLSGLVTYWLGVGALRRTSWMRRRHEARVAELSGSDRDASA